MDIWNSHKNRLHSHMLHTYEFEWRSFKFQWLNRHMNKTMELTQYGLLAQYCDIDMDPFWFRGWLVVWQQQAITRTKVDLSWQVFCGFKLWPKSREFLMNLFCKICWEITFCDGHISPRQRADTHFTVCLRYHLSWQSAFCNICVFFFSWEVLQNIQALQIIIIIIPYQKVVLDCWRIITPPRKKNPYKTHTHHHHIIFPSRY